MEKIGLALLKKGISSIDKKKLAFTLGSLGATGLKAAFDSVREQKKVEMMIEASLKKRGL